MKRTKTILMTLCAASLLACSCAKSPIPGNQVEKLRFTAEDYIFDDDVYPSTKTSLNTSTGRFAWAASDTAGIFPTTGSQVYFKLQTGAEAKSAEFDGGGWGLLTTSDYYSYYPFIGNIYLDRNEIPVSFLGQKQIGSEPNIGKYDYMYSKGVLTGNSLSFEFKHLCYIIRFQVTIPAGTYTKFAVTAPAKLLVSKGWFNLMETIPSIFGEELTNQITMDTESVVSDGSNYFYLYMVFAPINLSGQEITVSALNSERKEYQCKVTPSKEYVAGRIYALTCNTWTEVPQSMGLILEDWGDGGSIGGSAD